MRWYFTKRGRKQPCILTSQNGTYVLDEATHASLGDATTTEDLDGVCGSELCRSRAVRLEECNRASKLRRLLLIRLHA